MTEGSPAGPMDDGAMRALDARPLTELSTDELMALKDWHAAHGRRFYNSASTETVILAFLAGNVGVPFLQTISQRAANRVADGVASMSKQVTDAVRKYIRRNGGSDDTPRIELPAVMTDEAWLALFETVNAGGLHSGVLRWDEAASVWRAED
jgi:hypothetical protein